MRGQHERPGRDDRVAAGRQDAGHRCRPRAADPKRQRGSGEDDLRTAGPRACPGAPATRVQDEVATRTRLVDAIDRDLRDPVRQGQRRLDGHVADARGLVGIEPERRSGTRRTGDQLAEMDLEASRGTGHGVGRPERVTVDGADDAVPVPRDARDLAPDRLERVRARRGTGDLEADALRSRVDVDELDDLRPDGRRPPAVPVGDALGHGIRGRRREGDRRRGKVGGNVDRGAGERCRRSCDRALEPDRRDQRHGEHGGARSCSHRPPGGRCDGSWEGYEQGDATERPFHSDGPGVSAIVATLAAVLELADRADSNSAVREGMWVRVPPAVPDQDGRDAGASRPRIVAA